GSFAMELERESNGRGQRKLWRGAESAELLVKRREGGLDEGRFGWLRTRSGLGQTAGGLSHGVGFRVCSNLRSPRLEGVRCLLQHRGQAIARDERSTTAGGAVAREKGGRRPAAEAIALADVRTSVGVDADRDEPCVHNRDDG